MGKKGDDVKIDKMRDGCSLCGRTDSHTHGQDQWRAHVDQVGAAMRERNRK